MPPSLSLLHNVSFYDAAHPDFALGGLVQNGSITEANFLDILKILIVVKGSPLRVQSRMSSHIVSRTDAPLKTGIYDIYCDASIQVSDEACIHRSISPDTSDSNAEFVNQIRNRDRKCVISGIANPEIHIQAHNWISFDAAHIFPLEQESLWTQHNDGQFGTGMDDTCGSAKISSCQNGFLLDAAIHEKFNQYLISVNPDDNYKIVVFDIDNRGLDGRILDSACRDPADPRRVSDKFLRWHFRQSVLVNMRGAGEPIFEHNFPFETDVVGETLAGPLGSERFELEVSARLRGVFLEERCPILKGFSSY
ncbi:hypothetical protein HOY82DRAFT_551108 [Tuber indicum]|nr:hypothetical protein HOY82DRAFT_551108 [Tuber indicum]